MTYSNGFKIAKYASGLVEYKGLYLSLSVRETKFETRDIIEFSSALCLKCLICNTANVMSI